jgi:hypothetical protein
MSESSTPQGRKKRHPRVPPPPTYVEGWGYWDRTDRPPWQNPFPGGWGYPWWRIEHPPERPYGSWISPQILTFRKPFFSFLEPQGGQSFDSTSGAGSTISTSSGQVGLPRKKPRMEAPVSAPQP